jgi:hypothetical protein
MSAEAADASGRSSPGRGLDERDHAFLDFLVELAWDQGLADRGGAAVTTATAAPASSSPARRRDDR